MKLGGWFSDGFEKGSDAGIGLQWVVVLRGNGGSTCLNIIYCVRNVFHCFTVIIL